VAVTAPLAAQDPSRRAVVDSARVDLARVFLDCTTTGCDDEFFRTEITWVDFVRDRMAATVYVLVTSEQTGSGGQAFTLAFEGQGPFAGVKDSLRHTSRQGDSEDERRRVLVRLLSLGLLRYARSTSVGDQLQVAMRPRAPESTVARQGAKDRWNRWVFSVGANTFANGDETYKSANVYGNLDASRITEELKLNVGVNVGYTENRYELSDGALASYQHSIGSNALVAKSLTARWSAGVSGSVSSSKYENFKLAVRAMPSVEFDVFPYKESSRRQLIFRYGVGVRAFSYDSTTIYEKVREARPAHELTVASEARQKWGSLNVGVIGTQYLDDLSKRRLVLNGGATWRIVRGLEFNVFGSYELARDQLNISRGTLDDEDILIRLRQLRSGYNYFTSIGLSYTFGSIFNNVVNPRFGRGGQTMFMRM